jgi:hypothetical protein
VRGAVGHVQAMNNYKLWISGIHSAELCKLHCDRRAHVKTEIEAADQERENT